MSGQTFAHSAAPLRRIASVQFGVLSPDEIKALRSASPGPLPCSRAGGAGKDESRRTLAVSPRLTRPSPMTRVATGQRSAGSRIPGWAPSTGAPPLLA